MDYDDLMRARARTYTPAERATAEFMEATIRRRHKQGMTHQQIVAASLAMIAQHHPVTPQDVASVNHKIHAVLMRPEPPEPTERKAKMEGMKKGGMVKKTAPHLLHKGELVINSKTTDKLKKLFKK
jgi:hypothetical protein